MCKLFTQVIKEKKLDRFIFDTNIISGAVPR
jgi:hypothetical protein